MAETQIKIVRKSNNRIEPENDFRVKVGAGDIVTFMTDQNDPAVVGLSITFVGETPFGPGKQTVPYKTALPLAVTFDGPAKSKVFRFKCEIKVNGTPVTSSGEAGGEMEVIRPGSN
jgi:hypothetical protein